MAHLASWLFEVGPVLPGSMGPVPVTFSELFAWSGMTGQRITSEESVLLRSLSRDYCSQLQAAKARNAAPPYAPDGNTIGAGIMAAFRMSKVNHG